MDAPTLASLVSTNYAPTPAQAQHIHALLLQGEQDLAKLDREVPAALQHLILLRVKRKQLQAALTPLKVVLAPVRRCPPELLAEIFLCCRQNSLDALPYTITDPNEAPLLLTRVCAGWRAVALGMPRLWDILQLGTHDLRVGAVALPARARELAARARGRPLYLGVRDNRRILTHSHAAMDTICSLSETVRELCVDLVQDPCDKTCDVPAMLVDAVFPMLSSLDIHIPAARGAPYFAPDFGAILESFGRPPRLRRLDLTTSSDAPMEGDLLGTRIPWGQLTSLHLGTRIGIILARDILARCAALTTCILSNVEPVDEGDADELPPLAACVLPDLTSLTVALDPHDEGPISPLFQPFSFPALISLDIAAYGCPVDALLDLHARSAFPLTRLDLTNAELDAADLLAFLRLIPTLAELALARCECVADALFAAFTCPTPCSSSTSAPQLTLPLLTSLSLEQDAGSLDGDVVAEMVASLWRAAERGDTPFPLLKCVELELTGMRFSDAAERRLAEVAAAGFLVDRQERE